MIFNCEFSKTNLSGRSRRKQFAILRTHLMRVYKINYVSAYSKCDDKMILIEGNAKVDANILSGISFERPRVTANNNVLLDSKKKDIKIRFTVPIEIQTKQIVLILESKKREIIESHVDAIYNDILNFGNLII